MTSPDVMKRKVLILSVLVGVLFLAAAARGEQDKSSGVLSFRLENDMFAGTDRYYTNGVRMTWVSPAMTKADKNSRLPKWIHFLNKVGPFTGRTASENNVSIFLGQNTYTPSDIESSDLIRDDRPYAGMTYLGFGFYSRNTSIMDSLEFYFGIIGPHSFAEQSQKFLHDFFNWAYPQGWDNQLRDEPALELLFDHKWKFIQSGENEGFRYDAIPHLGAGLGNIYIGARAGVLLRCGWNLPEDFGTHLFLPGSGKTASSDKKDTVNNRQGRFGIYFYTGVEGETVLRDIFLDGNTFVKSHGVDRESFVAGIVGGVALTTGRFTIAYGYFYQTKRFKMQRGKQAYGQINISFSI